MKLFATENYAVAVQPHGTKFKLILAATLWNLDQWERGRRFHTLLPISHDCPDPVCLHKIRIHIIILGINEEMEISSQLSPWNKIRPLSSWEESVRAEYTFYFPLSNEMHFGSRLVLEWKEISYKSRKAVKVKNI